MKDEGNTPSTNRNQESNTQKFVENRPPNLRKSTQEGTKIVANRSQNRAKSDKKSESHSQGELGAPRGRISRLSGRNISTNLEPKIYQKRDKNNVKNRSLFDDSLDPRNGRKSMPKPLQNRCQNVPKSVTEESQEEKHEKCENERPSIVFARFF